MFHRRTLLVLALLFAAAVLPACSSNTLMRTPVIVADGLLDPHRFTPPDWQSSEAPVFIAAPRKLSGRASGPGRTYSNERNEVVRLGRATVEIGAGMAWETIAAESRAESRKENLRVELTAYEDYGVLWSSHLAPDFRFTRDYDFADIDRAASVRWIEEINEQLAASRRKQIYVYVHGFNTKFEKNTRLCADFWHYMTRDGVMMSFDWPSKGNPFSYQDDKANAEIAIRQFRTLLEFLASESDAERINIIAHSAGTRVVVEALRDLSLRYYDLPDGEAQAKTKVGRVVLAAPDMDFGAVMSAIADGCGRVTEGVMGYSSRRDKALALSGNIFGDIRLGNAIGKLPQNIVDAMVERGSPWVDATAAQKRYPSFVGHSYYHQNPMISSDIMLYLTVGASGAERGLIRDTETGFLVFPSDYEEKLPQIVEGLTEKYGWKPGDGG